MDAYSNTWSARRRIEFPGPTRHRRRPLVEHGRRALSRFRSSRKISIVPRGAASKDGRWDGTAAMAQESTTDLECRLAQAQRELSEAREQQTATADVLKVISRSAFDLQSVLDTLTQSSAQLCEAEMAGILRPRGEAHYWMTAFNFPSAFLEFMKTRPIFRDRSSFAGRALLEGHVVHSPDVLADPDFTYSDAQKLGGYRTVLCVPLLREGSPIGVVVLSRHKVRPFTDRQIELVTTFADQAVIAIENVRLFDEVQARTREVTESLEYQTAISEVLNVISRSPSDVQPVLDTIAETAQRLCQSEQAYVMKLDGGRYYPVAGKNVQSERIEYLRQHPIAPDRGSMCGRVALDRRTIHIIDAQTDPEYTLSMTGDRSGYRTILGVPLLREGVAIGVIVLTRAIVQPFTDKQIELVTTFADQALIAIENVRLFEAEQQRTRELGEALQQQTATSDVLQVISSSPGELGPVFQAMLENATRICEAKFGVFWQTEGQGYRSIAMYGVPPAYTSERDREPVIYPEPELPLGRLIQTKQVLQVADIRKDESYIKGFRPIVNLADNGGARTLLMVPMLKENELIGAIAIFRQEVRPFTEKQVELVTNFARQAVIAIENARLLNELRESLEQQIATADVLKVISRSRFELQPVFETVLVNAVRLCEAERSFIFLFDGKVVRAAASYNTSPELREFIERNPITPGRHSAAARAALERRTVHIPDVQADPEYTWGVGQVEPLRTLLAVPMLKGDELVGVIVTQKREVKPFTEAQFALLRTFADQAVIAIENARLLNELRESLQQQTATADVLKVISRTAFDLQPIFDTLVENVVRLCEAERAFLFRFDGKLLRSAACYNVSPELKEFVDTNPIAPGRHSISARAALERR